MSKETLQHLNTKVLIGNTDERGYAWSYRAEYQGEESNHYPGPIPVEDVLRRLFDWQAQSRRIAVEVPAGLDNMDHLDENGLPARWVTVVGKQAIARSDDTDGKVMGIFAPGYAMHQYDKWLLNEVANILDDDLGISSAGLLRDDAIAWVEVSVPESITTPEGVAFRPNLLATTSFDGSIATTYKRTFTLTVCDNTRADALAEDSPTLKVRHSRYSQLKMLDARKALAMVHTAAEDFIASITAACTTEVSPKQFSKFLDLWVPLEKDGEKLKGRSLTMATNKRDGLVKLYRHDQRVAPWAGTAHGVLQMVNTFEHHEGIVRGTSRAERNMLRTVTGDFERLDREVMATLTGVLAA